MRFSLIEEARRDTMHTLHLKAVDSCLATADELRAARLDTAPLPPGYRLRAHQVKTIDALRADDRAIIINDAMTGDGKTLAGQFNLLNDRQWKTFTMYPTNELSADQQRGLEDLVEHWPLAHWKGRRPAYRRIDAAELDKLQDASQDVTRAEALSRLVDNDLVLTNPDIFHLMIHGRYKRAGAAADLILGELVHRYKLFVFDEFHLFGAAQSASVMTAITLMNEMTAGGRDLPRFLFLSATPPTLLQHLAAKIGLEVRTLHGEYQHGLNDPPDGWQRILQPVSLTLHTGRLEDWIGEHLDDVVLRFFADHRPGAKGVIIANSVATAHRLYSFLADPCRQANISLGLNTGLVPRPDRVTNVDLLIATSTVDVGVDFRINLLIFESIDAATHIQRLGRLGRHKNDGKGSAFAVYEAHALLPQWVIEGIAAELPDGIHVDRTAYSTTLREKYPPLQQFESYVQRWAGVQSSHVLTELGKREIRTQYALISERLKQTYKTLFPGGMKKYIALVQDNRRAILDEAASFRGSSPFTALVLDSTHESQHVVAYSLTSLFRHADLKSEELKALYDHARRQGQSVKGLERSEPLAAYRLLGWLPKPRPVEIRLNDALSRENCDQVVQMRGFRIDAPDVPELSRLNRDLESRTLVAFLAPTQMPDDLRRRLRLGFQLELFNFRSADGIAGTAAFGRDALLLDAVINRSNRSNDNRPYIA